MLLTASNQTSERFGFTNRKLFFGKLFGELCAALVGRNGQNRTSVTGRDFFLIQHLLGVFGKVEQAQSVGNGRATLRNRARNFRLRAISTLHHALVAICLFNGIQIAALKVLDKRKLEHLHIVGLFNANGNLLQASKLRGLPTALTGNNLVALSIFTNQDRLQKAVFFNRKSQLVELFLIEMHTRLVRIRMHQFDRHLIQMVRSGLGGRLRSSSGFGLGLDLGCNGR